MDSGCFLSEECVVVATIPIIVHLRLYENSGDPSSMVLEHAITIGVEPHLSRHEVRMILEPAAFYKGTDIHMAISVQVHRLLDRAAPTPDYRHLPELSICVR